ncbi:MAG: siderophore-interacting protein [Chloroflexi bacterium]|nr:siderophore-interacting protein [Chloroflexota bacterium]
MSNEAEETPVHAPLPIKTFITSVARIEQLAHPFTRITFRGGDLAHFRSIGPDQFLYLLLPPTGRKDLTIDAAFEWSQYQAMPESEQPIGAYYTVRHHRPDVTELDIDIVKHGHEGQVGTWLKQAGPGDPVALWGPRMAYAPPPSTQRQLLIGDETALPAIASILDAGPIGARVDAIVELDPDTVLDLPELRGLTINRLDGPEAHQSKLPAALRGWTLNEADYVWGAGEFDLMRELKSYLRDCLGMPAEQVSMVGYWRRNPQP